MFAVISLMWDFKQAASLLQGLTGLVSLKYQNFFIWKYMHFHKTIFKWRFSLHSGSVAVNTHDVKIPSPIWPGSAKASMKLFTFYLWEFCLIKQTKIFLKWEEVRSSLEEKQPVCWTSEIPHERNDSKNSSCQYWAVELHIVFASLPTGDLFRSAQNGATFNWCNLLKSPKSTER